MLKGNINLDKYHHVSYFASIFFNEMLVACVTCNTYSLRVQFTYTKSNATFKSIMNTPTYINNNVTGAGRWRYLSRAALPYLITFGDITIIQGSRVTLFIKHTSVLFNLWFTLDDANKTNS